MNDLYNRIEALCKSHGVNITSMCRDAGVTRGNLSDLKMGRTSSLSAKNLGKISAYFNVSMDHLLGVEPSVSPSLTLDDFTYALYNESKELTEENKRKLIEMAQFFKQQQAKEQKP